MAPPSIDSEDEEMLVPHSEFPAPEGPQPSVEAALAEAANTVDAPVVDDPPSTRFTWTLENFSRLRGKKFYSDVFFIGGYKWRVLMYPKGNGVDHLSMYLDVADSITLPYGWSRCAQFSLAVVDQTRSKFTVRKDTQHQFDARESDWGFTTFMPLNELYDPSKGYLLNDTCIVEADVAVVAPAKAADTVDAPGEAANTVDAPIVDDPPSARFTWRLENFSRLRGKKLCSDVFLVGGYKWRVLMYPKGNGVDHLSMYLDVADSITLPYGWSRYAQFSLAVVDQTRNKFTVRKDTQHQFDARESDWGFTTFLPLNELYDPSKGYLLNDTCIVEADVAVVAPAEAANTIDAPAEAANTVDAPIVDDEPSARFTWRLENFSRLRGKKLCSDVFFVGGYKWRVLMYPKGNGVDHLSMYLDVADSITLPYGWSRYAQFSLAVVDQTRSKFTVCKDTQHQFDARESDWGFTTFMPLSELYDRSKGYLLNDTCIVKADVAVVAPSTIYSPVVDDPPSARFTWTLENFSRLRGKKFYSDVFFVGGYRWRVVMYPKGNGVDHLSMYLDVADSITLPYGWSRYAQFSLAVIDQTRSKFTVRKDTRHQFDARESDWGFTTFMPLSELYDPSKGYLLNDTCIIEANVVVAKVANVIT